MWRRRGDCGSGEMGRKEGEEEEEGGARGSLHAVVEGGMVRRRIMKRRKR